MNLGWGLIIGAGIGVIKGGFAGLLIGALAGHVVDRWITYLRSALTGNNAFSQALFTTLGHLAKADGHVTEAEIAVTEVLFNRMSLSKANRKRAIGWFNAGKDQQLDLQQVLKPFNELARFQPNLKRVFLEILIDVALADGALSQAEQRIMVRVTQILGLPTAVLQALLQMRVGPRGTAGAGAGGGARGARPPSRDQLADAYRVLGVEPSATDAEVKKAYRKLMSRYHPDKLVSQGLPEEMQSIAKEKAQAISAAYDRIEKSRRRS